MKVRVTSHGGINHKSDRVAPEFLGEAIAREQGAQLTLCPADPPAASAKAFELHALGYDAESPGAGRHGANQGGGTADIKHGVLCRAADKGIDVHACVARHAAEIQPQLVRELDRQPVAVGHLFGAACREN